MRVTINETTGDTVPHPIEIGGCSKVESATLKLDVPSTTDPMDNNLPPPVVTGFTGDATYIINTDMRAPGSQELIGEERRGKAEFSIRFYPVYKLDESISKEYIKGAKNCWAYAIAMMMSFHDDVCYTAEDAMGKLGADFTDKFETDAGLKASSNQELADRMGGTADIIPDLTSEELSSLIQNYGPLYVSIQIGNEPHAFVATGIDPDTGNIYYIDPADVEAGEKQGNIAQLQQLYNNLQGNWPKIIHYLTKPKKKPVLLGEGSGELSLEEVRYVTTAIAGKEEAKMERVDNEGDASAVETNTVNGQVIFQRTVAKPEMKLKRIAIHVIENNCWLEIDAFMFEGCLNL